MLYWWRAILGVSDVAHADPGIADGLQRNVVELVHVVDEAVRVDVIIERADLNIAGGQDQILIVDGVHHVHHAEVARNQFVRIDVAP